MRFTLVTSLTRRTNHMHRPFKMMPREIRSKVIASSKMSSFMYVESAMVRLTMHTGPPVHRPTYRGCLRGAITHYLPSPPLVMHADVINNMLRVT